MNKEIPIEFLLHRGRLFDVQYAKDGTLYWAGTQNGNNFLSSMKNGEIRKLDLSLKPRGGSLYGGGEMDCAKHLVVMCVEGSQLYTIQKENGDCSALTPSWGRIGAPSLSPDEKWVLFNYSDGATDLIGITPMHGNDWPRQLVKGADFYLKPTWHPNGELIAWTEWDHPYMPWQASRVKIGEVGGMQLRLFNETWIAGKIGCSAHQPVFSPDGRWLSYLEQTEEWESLVLMDVETKEKKVLLKADNFMLSTHDWVQGLRSYTWSGDAKHIYYLRFANAQNTLWKINIHDGKTQQILTAPFTWISQLTHSPTSNSLAFLASAYNKPKQVVMLEDEEIIPMSSLQEESELTVSIPVPQQIEWTAEDGTTLQGLLYLPQEEKIQKPPLLVEVHGGPTMQRSLSYAVEAGFFTSHGIAYFQVNYRGSTGYGRSYQDALEGNWGEIEVRDVYSGVSSLVQQGLIDGTHVALIGSSSGGTSVLNILRKYPGKFRCAICSYGIGDLIADAQQTHKFESCYHRYLVGDLTGEREKFEARSPLFHIDEIKDPLLLFHGSDDRVVHPSQSEALYASLHDRGIACDLRIFEGEGHGFRQEEHLREYYEKTLAFLQQYLF